MIEGGDIMPAGYAHYIFGQKVLNKLKPETKELINRNIDLYNIGVHGPDILFYYNPLSKNKVNQLGSQMHREEAYHFFEFAKEVIKNSKDKEASIAYVYGFITHFTLDHTCHHYVGEVEKETGLTHLEIESELDRAILVKNHLNPLTTSLTTHIHPNQYVSKIISPFFHLEEKDIYKALKDLLLYLGLIKAPGKIKRNMVYLGMKIGGIYHSHRGLLINYEPNEKATDDIKELLNKLNNSVDIAVKLIEEFLDNKLDDIYHNDFE